MIRWIQKIKSLFDLADRLGVIESELSELETKLQLAVNQYSKEFEVKIQQMAFNYTKNLDDTKSDYLKKHLEVRVDCMQQELSSLPVNIDAIRDQMDWYMRINGFIEHKDEEHE